VSGFFVDAEVDSYSSCSKVENGQKSELLFILTETIDGLGDGNCLGWPFFDLNRRRIRGHSSSPTAVSDSWADGRVYGGFTNVPRFQDFCSSALVSVREVAIIRMQYFRLEASSMFSTKAQASLRLRALAGRVRTRVTSVTRSEGKLLVRVPMSECDPPTAAGRRRHYHTFAETKYVCSSQTANTCLHLSTVLHYPLKTGIIDETVGDRFPGPAGLDEFANVSSDKNSFLSGS